MVHLESNVRRCCSCFAMGRHSQGGGRMQLAPAILRVVCIAIYRSTAGMVFTRGCVAQWRHPLLLAVLGDDLEAVRNCLDADKQARTLSSLTLRPGCGTPQK